MEEILNEMIETLEELANEKVTLSKIYKEFYTADVKKRDIDDGMKTFLIDSIDLITGFDTEIKIDDFNPNEIMLYMYNLNLENIKELESYALKLYRLYKNENKAIPYYDELENKKIQELKLLKEKDFISVKEFELLYGYSSTAQKGFRGRLRNPIPFIQKGLGSKVTYETKEVLKWLKKEK